MKRARVTSLPDKVGDELGESKLLDDQGKEVFLVKKNGKRRQLVAMGGAAGQNSDGKLAFVNSDVDLKKPQAAPCIIKEKKTTQTPEKKIVRCKLLDNLPARGTFTKLSKADIEENKNRLVIPTHVPTYNSLKGCKFVKNDETNILVRDLRTKKRKERAKLRCEKSRANATTSTPAGVRNKPTKFSPKAVITNTPNGAASQLDSIVSPESQMLAVISPRLGASRVRTPPPRRQSSETNTVVSEPGTDTQGLGEEGLGEVPTTETVARTPQVERPQEQETTTTTTTTT